MNDPEAPASPDAFTLGAGAAPGAVAEMLDRFGLARIPGHVEGDRLGRLREEFEALLAEPSAGRRAIEYEAGDAVALTRAQLDTARFPATAETFDSPFARALVRAQVGRFALVNHQIWLTHDLPRPQAINQLHYDRIPTLKFFLYLDAAEEEDGALCCVPTSHHLSRRIQRYHRARGVRVVDLPNFETPEGLPAPIPVGGAPGCLIVFWTDVYHRGGHVRPGHERRVMRGHSIGRPRIRYHRPLPGTPQWLAEARWNPLPWLRRRTDGLAGQTPPGRTTPRAPGD